MHHSGSTAGYRAFLTRYPDQRVSVAVLCNVAGAPATQYAHAVADLYLGDRVKAIATPPFLSSTEASHPLSLMIRPTNSLRLGL